MRSRLARLASSTTRGHPPIPAVSCVYRNAESRRLSSSAVTGPLAHPSSTGTSAFNTTPGYGQSLPSTHPHLLQSGELTPGISAAEYEERRRSLIRNLDDGSVVIIAGARLKYASAKIFYKFRQESNFWYLTGWQEPDSVLVLEKNSSLRGYKMTMFVPVKDANDEIWNGPRSGREGATEVFGADEAFDIALLAPRLRSILEAPSTSFSKKTIFIDLPGIETRSRHRDRAQKRSLFDYLVPKSLSADAADDVIKLLNDGNFATKSAAAEVEKLRLIKSEAEIKLMRRAADLSANAHTKVMRFCEPTETSGRTEHSLVSHFEYHTALGGAQRPAYVPVCSSGTSGLTIHYTQNSLPLRSGTLVSLDAGCELHGYASDITRTFPVNGKFSTAQKALYEALLRVHKACLELCHEDCGYTMESLHRHSVDLMRIELTDLGFHLRGGDLEKILYPHFLTHPLGIDLHDTPSFSRGEKIKAGMVITIEPGIFVPANSNFPKGFHGLSVRVEDEVLVRESDQIILSVDAPKEIVDIEAACQGLLEPRRSHEI